MWNRRATLDATWAKNFLADPDQSAGQMVYLHFPSEEDGTASLDLITSSGFWLFSSGTCGFPEGPPGSPGLSSSPLPLPIEQLPQGVNV